MGRRFTQSGIRFIKVETIGTDGQYLADKGAFIDADTHNLLRRSQLREGDILFSIAGALGRSTVVQASWLPANTNQAFAVIRPSQHSQIDPRYLLWALRSDAIQTRVAEINVRAAQANLSLAQVREFEIAIPEPQNQGRIANVLDDATDLTAALRCLIAKKHAIRQGMMQQLLTGKTRMPGFTGGWSTHRLHQLGTFLKGRGITRDDVRGSGVACIRYGELYTTFREYTATAVSFVTPSVAVTALPLRQGDLLFAGSGETHKEIGMCVAFTGGQRAVAGGDIIVLRAPGINPVYLSSLMNTPQVAAQKARLGQGDAVVHINSRALASIEVDLPSRSEQDAIAEVIVDTDSDIRQVEVWLTKAEAIKRGMMQELLTGHTGLPVTERVAA